MWQSKHTFYVKAVLDFATSKERQVVRYKYEVVQVDGPGTDRIGNPDISRNKEETCCETKSNAEQCHAQPLYWYAPSVSLSFGALTCFWAVASPVATQFSYRLLLDH